MGNTDDACRWTASFCGVKASVTTKRARRAELSRRESMVNDVDLDLWALLQRGKPISVLVAKSVCSAIGVREDALVGT
jgi:hypothetical protein